MAIILAQGKQQYFDDSGNPLNGGKLWTMQPGVGVTTPKATWTDAGETAFNANPIILNARGEATVFWNGAYNVRLETAAGGLIWTVENIGVSATPVPIGTLVDADDYANLQAAVDAVYALGGGTVAVYTNQTLATCLVAKNGVTVWTPNNSTTITITGAAVQWPLYTAVLLGGYMDVEWPRATTYPANAILRGNPTVTLTTAGHAANFAVGDVVAVETVSTFTVGANDLPTWAQINVITSVNVGTGVLGLRHSIDAAYASVRVRQLQTSLFMRDAALNPTTIPLRAVRDFSLLGGTWITSENVAPFNGAGGAVDCVIAPHRTICAMSPAYGNLFGYCRFETDLVEVRRTPIELAFSSHGNTVKFGHITCKDTAQVVDRLVGLNSSARDNKIEVTDFNFGNDAAVYGIEIINAYRNSISIHSLIGATVTNSTIQASYFNYPLSVPNTEVYPTFNDIHIGTSNVTSQAAYINLGTGVAAYNITGRFFGAVSLTSSVLVDVAVDNSIDVWAENKGPIFTGGASGNKVLGRFGVDAAAPANYTAIGDNVYDYETPAYKVLRDLDFMLSAGAVTNATAFKKTVTYPLATILPGDIFRFTLKGATTGAGNKTLQLTFAGVLLLDLSGGSLIAGAAGVDVDVDLVVANNTTAVASVRRVIGATVTLTDVGVSGKNFTTTAYDFVEDITVTAAVDTFTYRVTRLKHHRPFTCNRDLP